VERRVWLQREADARIAMLLAFAPQGQSLNLALPTGATLEAELAFAPEAVPLRAVIVEQGPLSTEPEPADSYPTAPTTPDHAHAETQTQAQAPMPAQTPQGGTLDEAAAAFAAALAADPWTRSIPFVLDAAVPLPAAGKQPWAIVDAKGGGLVALLPEAEGEADATRAEQLGLALLACGGGHPAPLFGLYRPGGLTPVTIWHDGEAANL
jgi:hypothetical protein